MSDFAKDVRDFLTYAEESDRHNREEGELDLEFEGFHQWNDTTRREREGNGLPCLTINTTQQYTGLVVGDWLANETSIRVLPREDGDKDVADVRQELIRSIELQSRAGHIYASSFGQMLSCGISNFRIDIEDSVGNPFQRDIFIRDIPDPFAVRWDPLAFDPTGADAERCILGDEITVDEYKARYPKAALPSLLQREYGSQWCDGKTVFLPEYWEMQTRKRTMAMTADGKVVDLADTPKSKWPKIALDPDTKEKIIRDDVKCKYAVMTLTNGAEELADPFELKIPRIPIIRVMGKEVMTPKGRVRFGLVRCLRDSQLMRNYLRSIRMELLLKAPRANFFGPQSAFLGREDDFPGALKFNDGATPPQQITGQNIAALLNEEEMLAQDAMEVSGLHEASRGMPSNEQSGRAIMARQSEGDTATAIYHSHMNAAQEAAGEVIDALIPVIFDTARTIRTIGPDLGVKMIRANDPLDPESIDLGVGTYDVTISTGPSFATRRQQAVEQLMELASRAPQIAQAAPDIIVGEMDLVNGDALQERLRRTVPPQILGNDAEDGKDPEEIAADQQKAQQAQQMQQMQIEMQMEGAKAELQLKQAQAQEAQAKAELAQSQAMKAKIEAMGMASGQPEPGVEAEEQRTAIMGYDAITRRLAAIEKGNMPGTPPALEQHLAPIIANAVGQALAKHLGFAPVELGLPSADPSLGEIDPNAPTVQPDPQGIAA